MKCIKSVRSIQDFMNTLENDESGIIDCLKIVGKKFYITVYFNALNTVNSRGYWGPPATFCRCHTAPFAAMSGKSG